MDRNEQGGAYLRLKQESRALRLEIASLTASFGFLGDSLAANAAILKKSPVDWNIDAELLAQDILKAGTDRVRYLDLLRQESENRTAVEEFEGVL